MASCAASSNAGGPSSSGKPCPRFTAPMRAASADTSANTVVAYGRSRDTVMVHELRRATMRAACGPRWGATIGLRSGPGRCHSCHIGLCRPGCSFCPRRSDNLWVSLKGGQIGCLTAQRLMWQLRPMRRDARHISPAKSRPTNRLAGSPVTVLLLGLVSKSNLNPSFPEQEADMSEEAFVYEAIRTPRGKQKNGALNEVKPVNLVIGLIEELRKRNPDLDENLISDVILGCVSPVGDQGGDIARAAVLASGMPVTSGGVQLNRFCASGLEAVNTAAQKVRSGWDDLVLAGGVESMSRVPMGSDGGAMGLDPATNYEVMFVPQGIGADLIATIEGFSREDVDKYALRSQEKAAEAWSGGYFAKSVVPVRDQNGLLILDHDEHMRPDTTKEGLGKLKSAFEGLAAMGGFDDVALQRYHWVEKINHVHTGGNSSGIVDGAALVMIGSEAAGKSQGLTPRARVVATATSGADPVIMLTGPTPATRKVLDRAGLTVDDIDLFELNEAFASVVLKFQKDLDIADEKLNVNGGAIAMGHPLGATGAMITGTMVDELERRNARRALVTLCIGGGMGVATIIERV